MIPPNSLIVHSPPRRTVLAAATAAGATEPAAAAPPAAAGPYPRGPLAGPPGRRVIR
jgi:hypothetical protein